jgi:uncharacterized protein
VNSDNLNLIKIDIISNMKFSRFNICLRYGEEFVLYNTLEQRLLFLQPELKDLLDKKKAYELEKKHPEFYNYLIEEKFIINDEIDELDKIKKISKSVDEDNSLFLLTINPTMNCNFKCWYCYETLVKNSRLDEKGLQKIKKLVDTITRNEELKNMNISFFGGEPLLYFQKNVVPIIEYYIKKCEQRNINAYVSFTTNGYLANQEFIDFFINKKVRCNLQITLDGNREEHNKVRFVTKNKGSYDKIVQNIKKLIKNKLYVTVRVNFTDLNIKNAHTIYDDFNDVEEDTKNEFLKFDFHRVWQNKEVDHVHDIAVNEMNQINRKGGKTTCFEYSPDTLRNSCYADKKNSAVVNYNGDIFKCTARDFSTKNREGYLAENGELLWENNSLEKRMNSKFKNRPCLECKILPLCNGGCSQTALESIAANKEYCIYSWDEVEKEKVVRTKISEILENANN